MINPLLIEQIKYEVVHAQNSFFVAFVDVQKVLNITCFGRISPPLRNLVFNNIVEEIMKHE